MTRAITFDLDWASEADRARVPTTWFITHQTGLLNEQLLSYFELEVLLNYRGWKTISELAK